VFQKSNIKCVGPGAGKVVVYIQSFPRYDWSQLLFFIESFHNFIVFLFLCLYYLFISALSAVCLLDHAQWRTEGGGGPSWTRGRPAARCSQISWGPTDSPYGASLCKKVL